MSIVGYETCEERDDADGVWWYYHDRCLPTSAPWPVEITRAIGRIEAIASDLVCDTCGAYLSDEPEHYVLPGPHNRKEEDV